MDEMKRHFRPEFLNRLDKIIIFHPLTHENLKEIVGLLVTDLEKRLKDKSLRLQLSPGAHDLLAKLSYDADYGARPARRVIQHRIEDEIAELLLDEKFHEGDTIKILKNKKGDGFEFKKA